MQDHDLILILRTRITSAEPHVTVTCTLRHGLLPEMGGQDNAWPLAGLNPQALPYDIIATP
jgi:hypothetical protein